MTKMRSCASVYVLDISGGYWQVRVFSFSLQLTLCLTLLHLRISQQFSDPLERTLCSPLFTLRRASLTKALLMELSRFRKQSLLPTTASQPNLTRALRGPLSASLKVQNSTIISCQMKLSINQSCHQNLQILLNQFWKHTAHRSLLTLRVEWTPMLYRSTNLNINQIMLMLCLKPFL